jgi:hypothetical protein
MPVENTEHLPVAAQREGGREGGWVGGGRETVRGEREERMGAGREAGRNLERGSLRAIRWG